MRRRSGTLDIYAWKDPQEYEAEYQCIASNEHGSAYSNKILLRLSSESSLLKYAGVAWDQRHAE